MKRALTALLVAFAVVGMATGGVVAATPSENAQPFSDTIDDDDVTNSEDGEANSEQKWDNADDGGHVNEPQDKKDDIENSEDENNADDESNSNDGGHEHTTEDRE